MYRPQFPYPPPPKGCEDIDCRYAFDQTNVAALAGTIAANSFFQYIPLQLDQDADFFLRGIRIAATSLLLGLFDPGGHPLLLPSTAGAPPVIENDLWFEFDGGPLITLESDNWGIYCPAGSAFALNMQNTTGSGQSGPIITLHGIKRFGRAAC